MKMEEAKKHVEEIRRDRFWIGEEKKNPLRKALRMAVKYLSAELYSKDVHFLMELIQNAEDNEYPEGVEPSLEFIVTSRDITASGAPATLLVFNNEKGFSRKNIESICSVGESTKAGNRKRGYIGEKGIGFKSVFLLTAQPYIFSNGYQIRFSETPCRESDIAYIVPEWVGDNPSVSQLQQIYGRDKTLPTTMLILPLKADKVKVVKEQLSCLHPELLLFLSKIKRLSVKEDNEDPRLITVRCISISSERDFLVKKNIDAESYTVHLATEDEEKCQYYMWKQRFPVKKDNKVEKRMDVEEWAITLAFPFGSRLSKGMSSVGLYAFLPTETVTNLPFIIQADFLLPSSRETILWDDKWNEGILDCVPAAFMNAFLSLVKTREDAPVSSLASMFAFLPVDSSSHPKLNVIRESIKEKLLQESIIPSESHSEQKCFHKPTEIGRLMPAFWKILLQAKRQGAKLHNLSSHGKHILHSSFDTDEYNVVLNFLGVKYMDYDWYPKCIQSCNLVSGVGEDVYMELLCFLSENWDPHFDRDTVRSMPLLKYVSGSGDVAVLSINAVANRSSYLSLCRSRDPSHTSWLVNWSKVFISATNVAFLPEKMQEHCLRMDAVLSWLRDHVKVRTLDVYNYADTIHNSLGNNPRLVLSFAHLLYHSFSKRFLCKSELESLCRRMPLIDSYGYVSLTRKGILVPASGSKWVDLMGSNPWASEDVVELSYLYLSSGQYAGHFTPQKELVKFLQSYAGASDIPELHPPKSGFPTVSGPLKKENALLLLDWIQNLRSRGTRLPYRFLDCIKDGSWLRVTVSGCTGIYKPPCQSFLPSSSWGTLLQSGSNMVDIPLVDQHFYDNKLNQYREELKAIGVMSEYGQACEFIGKHLMSMAEEYSLTSTKVIAMLKFIRFLRTKLLPVDEFVISIRNVKWVKTSCGDRSPFETVLYGESWQAASVISDIPFLDEDYYGNDVLRYKNELSLLGVIVDFNNNYKIVLDHLKPATSLNSLKPESLIFALKCICNSSSSGNLVSLLNASKCLKTNMGFLSPSECFLLDQEWSCLLQVFEDFPSVDGDFYGSCIFQYKDTLKKIGVVVESDVAIEKFCTKFKQRASTNSFTKENALSLITCYRKLKAACKTLPGRLKSCVREVKWLRTRLGDRRSPADCILFNPDWKPITEITLLPFIDDSTSCYGKGIHEYRDELKSMGVVVDIKECSRFVLPNLYLPHDPLAITPASFISLLQCIRNSKLNGQESFPEAFLKEVDKTKWLKTTIGYMFPRECLLFDPTVKPLRQCDGPFIDEEHYGILSSYKAELTALGVVVDLRSSAASSLLYDHIKSLTDFAKIERIYDYLRLTKWKLDDGACRRIWFPTSSDDGLWVNPEECVLHDGSGLFKTRVHVLDQTEYKPELLMFISNIFDVRRNPSTDDYCILWNEWQNSRHLVSVYECSAFWGHVLRNWSSTTEKMVLENVAKIPAASGGSSDIHLLSKQNVFIPDDLLLKDLFEKSSPQSIFVWCPGKNLSSSSRRKLTDIYSKIGVRKISESVSICDLSDLTSAEKKQVNREDASIVKGLVIIILGFLADPGLNIEAKNRHDTVRSLLNVTVFETLKPITRSYTVKMTSGDIVEVSTSKMVRWEKENSEILAQRLNRSSGYKSVIEYATMFAEEIARGLLWDKGDLITRLAELIKFGFLMDFDEDAVVYFMKSKNLQIFAEDKEFLCSVFPSQ